MGRWSVHCGAAQVCGLWFRPEDGISVGGLAFVKSGLPRQLQVYIGPSYPGNR